MGDGWTQASFTDDEHRLGRIGNVVVYFRVLMGVWVPDLAFHCNFRSVQQVGRGSSNTKETTPSLRVREAAYGSTLVSASSRVGGMYHVPLAKTVTITRTSVLLQLRTILCTVLASSHALLLANSVPADCWRKNQGRIKKRGESPASVNDPN